MKAEIIYRKNSITVYNLIKSGRENIDIIALILCESHFRDSYTRLIEYIAMPFLYFFNRKRFDLLSVGIGQIQLRYWNDRCQSPLSIHSFQKYFSTFENYDLLKSRIERELKNDFSDSKLIAFHTGETRSYHYRIFKEIKSITKLHLTMYKNNRAISC